MPSSNRTRGSDLLVKTLLEVGVERIYTLSGNHIMSIFDACLGSGIQLLHTRHEAACVHMADAEGRLTGRPAVAMVTGGPGHANAIGALYTALMAESPMVLLSGQSPVSQQGKGAFQEIDQVALAAPVVKAAWSISDASCLQNDIRLAFKIAAEGRPGPVSLSLPSDVMEELAVHQANGLSEAAKKVSPAAGGELQIARTCAEAVAWLHAGKRPLILAGPMMLAGGRRSSFAALEKKLGIPAIAMDSPRGVDDPRLGGFATQLGRADRVLLLGKRVDFTLRFGGAAAFSADCEFMQLEAEQRELQRARENLKTRLIRQQLADPDQCLASIAALPSDGSTGSSGSRSAGATSNTGTPGGSADEGWLAEVKHSCAARPQAWAQIPKSRSQVLHPAQIGRVLSEFLHDHPNAVLISDGGEFGQWVQACLDPERRLINGPAGAIGVALPMALAARAVEPDAPVVALMGDGAFGFHPMEFDTSVRSGLPFIVIIGNDQRWNAEYQIQLKQYGADRLSGCELTDPSYEQIAVAMGGAGMRIRSEGDLSVALATAVKSKLPYCLNVSVEGLAAPSLKG